MLLWIWRQVFWCRRKCSREIFTKKKPKVPHYKLPWLWIGAVVDGKTITATDVINYCVEPGYRVDTNFLAIMSGIRTADRWVYLDSKTLEERIFPSSGIVIENDS